MKKNHKHQPGDKQLRLMHVSEDRSGLHKKDNFEQSILFGDTGLKTGNMPQKKKPAVH